MNLNVEHNLSDEELCRAIAGIAIASGLQEPLQKAMRNNNGCDDNTPKEPRTKAMRILFHMMQQEYWQAARDIERYARMINKGELEKATSHSRIRRRPDPVGGLSASTRSARTMEATRTRGCRDYPGNLRCLGTGRDVLRSQRFLDG